MSSDKLNYWNNEMNQSKEFANNLGVPEDDFQKINKWIESWVKINQLNEPGNEQNNNFKRAYFMLQDSTIDLNDQSSKYLIGRLIKMYDIIWGGILSSTIDGSTMQIKHFIDGFESKLSFSTFEFVSLLSYLINTPVSPNSNIFESIWVIEKRSKFFATSQIDFQNKALIFLLQLNGSRGFHHNLKDFKKILSFVGQENSEVFSYLKSYQVRNNQGCYKAINYILMHFIREKGYEDKKNAHEIILWLDNAEGSSPKKPWLDKLDSIQKQFLEIEINEIAKWLIDNKHLDREEGTGWIDDIFKRFHKSALWYLNMTSSA
ncbi:hypothetical protein D7Z26_09405 [Cohnella endophytica]|uniref:Uncharacterized protein n=1 Tax=Cohnella endophytica TaxID=2419778 RepID=A0A494Y069_9BACL|nr:hypothetical protein [Cohnella endophytica]RKP55398.1 hypothetical protein D7Z26_09405 [Cohnella endophytica]